MKRLLRTAIQTGTFTYHSSDWESILIYARVGAIAGFFSIITLIVYLCLPNTFLAKITAIPIGCIYFAVRAKIDCCPRLFSHLKSP